MANLVRWNPLRELRDMRDISEVMDRFFSDPWLRGGRDMDGERLWRLPMDAYTTDDAIVIQMELPGVAQEDVNITLENDILTITGELKPRDDNLNYFLRERAQGRFERVLSVGTPVDAGKAAATFKDGLLVLTLPKREEVKPKAITIKKK